MDVAENPKPPTVVPPAKGGWLRAEMPNAAALIDDLRAQLGPEIVQGMMDNLKHGRGHIVDETTGLALGKVPDTYQVLARDKRGVSRVIPKG